MEIRTPRFSFRKLVTSHGWAYLPPFEWDDRRGGLSRPLRLADGQHVVTRIRMRYRDGASVVSVRFDRPLDPAERSVAMAQVRRMLSLDVDLSEFHALCAQHAPLKFVARSRCGRMLRSPSAFEDLIKTICTVNCDWRNTEGMCEALCTLGGAGFPGAEEILRFSEKALARVAPVGYRARTIRTVAKLIADGKLPLDDWAKGGQFDLVRRSLGDIWGLGPYSIAHMLVLLGDFSEIPVDSIALRHLREMHFNGRSVSPKKAVRPYEAYGKFRFLAYRFSRMAWRRSAAEPK